MSMDVLVPIIVVEREGSEESVSPLRYQDMVNGWSPCVTMQDTWAKAPSFIMFLPKDKGRRSGGSEENGFITSQTQL